MTSLAFQKALNVISLVSINFTELIVHDLCVCLFVVYSRLSNFSAILRLEIIVLFQVFFSERQLRVMILCFVSYSRLSTFSSIRQLSPLPVTGLQI
jgi:hypothetical protein